MMCPSLLKLPDASASGLPARALLGFMDREEASAFLLENCIFRENLSLSLAEEVWQTQKAVVDAVAPVEPAPPRRIPLSAADLKSARKFRIKHPDETSIVDFVSLNPMDLVVHQHWISTAIAERYSGAVAPDKWHRTSLLDPPADSGVKWRREEGAIVFDLPKFEYMLMGPFTPDGTMRPGTALDFVSVAFHRERALLINGYHRTFAAAQYGLQTVNAPRGVLFGVSNFLDLMGSGADQTRSMLESQRPPRMADFFDDRLAIPVILRKKRYQMRIHVEVVALDAEATEECDQSPTARLAGSIPLTTSLPVNAVIDDAVRHYHAGRLDAAADQCRRALFMKPDSAEANNIFGAVLVKQDKIAEASEHCSRALALKPDYADAHLNLGHIRVLQGNPDAAIVHQRRVIALDPNHADAHQQLGSALVSKGEFAEAMMHCQRAIAIQPDHADAHFTRAGIKTFYRGDPDLEAMEHLVANNHLPPERLTMIHFGLAKALEDVGDFDRAFHHLSVGNALKRSLVSYDEPAVMKLYDRLASTFDRNLFEQTQSSGNNSTLPIFVLGMPRSGSTLVEQILASHPQVHAGGELPYMSTAASRIFQQTGNIFLPGNGQDREALQSAAAYYLGEVRSLAGSKARIVDKLPGNFPYVGLIHLLLPNARIIHTMRDPLDSCISCYSKLFYKSCDYSYELGELGRFYRRYNAMMEHWRSVLPAGTVLDVVYEDVVEDLEGQARRLIDYCGLPWDDRCLDFHHTDRAISTASNFQARQPLFRSSLQRWRKYEFGLGPLIEALGNVIGAPAAMQRGMGTT